MFRFMRILVTLIFCILLLYLFPSIVLSEVIVPDMIVLNGKEIMLSAETKGKLFAKGGEVVEFFVDGKSIGKRLSGGDGFAFKQFIPQKSGLHQITVKSGKDKGNGLLLSLKRGERMVFIDVGGSLFEGLFSKKPKTGSQKIIKKISSRFPIVFLQTELLSIKAIKAWLKENGFTDLPVIPWRQGMIFDEIKEKGLKIKAIIGSQSVIESAKAYNKPKSFSFEEVEDAEEVKDWEEIGKKLK
ncbi:MAG: hypothetical protein COY75_00720 [Nitrospirae bacterium CG_4_10_14_0_8_um_filter_41_23]|nr:MAG: hypothetical protein AUK38_03060 [Nitrospirae bacterium CG2_30_41_42]PIV44573.1 MAG: hypothetical protein COS27_01365 [Nitrospirae bacterium CG02_land_8_20_14_3_00_41_53]PIW87343.1 MAG: hypothetical protein COZ94_05655 [Nitrospirae bacterium CG_4_8_14_3_um_filter_41_47]PIY87815.1 MAG: hypothetical protein COY75_00720 [Nitrospirae bacterium CG_4_10_14_0_8_um_filter_41_23]PJA79936.1 MAG: hypothetical protein CO148_05245 [Nitrospirae bacterium CG_4_9_14_3_um_filter_41_27]